MTEHDFLGSSQTTAETLHFPKLWCSRML